MSHPDTIVAAATAPGRGGIGIVRISGARTPEIAAVILGELPPARRAPSSRTRLMSASTTSGPPWPCNSSTCSPV